MNNNQFSQILKLVQLDNELNTINNKYQRLQQQHQQITGKRERILQNLLLSGVPKEEVENYYQSIKQNQI